MWGRRELLLAAAVVSALNYRVSAELLGETPSADQYQRCREKAVKETIHSGQLGQELHERLRKPWSNYTTCSMPIPRGEKEHAAALAAYYNEEDHINHINGTMEKEVVEANTYENIFPFKALHLLLMDALMLLRPSGCKTVYYVTEKTRTAEVGSRVRFTTFKTVYTGLDAAEHDLDSMTVYNINTCFFADLSENSCVRNKKVALVSPAEQFTVERVGPRTYDDAEYTEIFLKHSQVLSFYKCDTPSRSPADVSTQWLVSLLVALSLFFCLC